MMKAKKWFSLALALMMLVSLSAGIAGGTAYAADAAFEETFETYEANKSPAAFDAYAGTTDPDVTTGVSADYKIATETDADGTVTNKYLELGNTGKAVSLNLPITEGPVIDFYSDEDDSVYALEFDFKVSGTNSNKYVTLAYPAAYRNVRTEFYFAGGQVWYYSENTPKAGATWASDEWHKVKMIYRTKDRAFDVYHDGQFIATAQYRITSSVSSGNDAAITTSPENLILTSNAGGTMGIDNVKLYKTTKPTAADYGFIESFEADKYVADATPTFDTNSTMEADYYKIKSDDSNKYLQLGGTLTAKYDKYVRVPVTTKLDLLSTADDSIYALEFDFKSSGANVRHRITLTEYSHTSTEIMLVNNTLYYYDKNSGGPITGPTFDYNKWHRIKIVYYTKYQQYGVFLDGVNVGFAGYALQKGTESLTSYTAKYLAIRMENLLSEENAQTMGIDNIKIYKTDEKLAHYGSPKLWSGEYDNNPVNVTAGFTAGTITAEADIVNLTENTVPVTLLAALYNGDTLEKVSIKSGSYETGSIDVPAQIYTDLTVESTEGRTLKVFLWDGLSKLIPLSVAATFDPAA